MTMAGIDYMNAKGWLTDGERQLLHNLAAQLGPGRTILNIGVEYGASLACLCAGAATRGANVVGFDIDMSKVLSGGYGAKLYEADSHQVVKLWIRPLDLIFVDGDHGKAGVLMDAQFADFLPIGGHILFQDCWDWDVPNIPNRMCDGVNAAVVEWFTAHNQEFEELPSVGTTRVFKRVKEIKHERNLAGGSGADSDLREAGDPDKYGSTSEPKFEVRRSTKNSNRGR